MRRSKRTRQPNPKYSNIDCSSKKKNQQLSKNTLIDKSKRKRKQSISISAPSTPIPASASPSVITPDIQDVPPSCTLPEFRTTKNIKLKSRNKTNTKHLELSAFDWVTRWLEKNKSWPATSYPWVQWALMYHRESEFIWYVGSTPDQVAARATDFAVMHSKSRPNFKVKLKSWWDTMAGFLLPLQNRSFKPVSLRITCFKCICMSTCVFVCLQQNKNEYVHASCHALTLPPSEVLKQLKDQRRVAFDSQSVGYEMGMQECPNCGKLGLFVHDGKQAKCVHPEHDRICAEKNKKAAEEAAAAKRLATEARKTKCQTCGCWAMIRPGDYKPEEGAEERPHRCDRHKCLKAENMEIACGGQCDGCMQVVCTRCDRCKCYQSGYSSRRCDECMKLHSKDREKYPLQPAFPSSRAKLVICNICTLLASDRTRNAEKARRDERNASAYRYVRMHVCECRSVVCVCAHYFIAYVLILYRDLGYGNRRQEERITLHLRKWRALCTRDNLKPNSKEASRLLSSLKGCAGYFGNEASWKYLSKKFFMRKAEKNRVYNTENLDEYINIPKKFTPY